jgi:S1-C subfamily serine protease
MIEPLLLSATRVSTFRDATMLTAATGFFFHRDQALFLVTSRHVVFDQAAGHLPDRIEFVLHTDVQDLTRVAAISIRLYDRGQAVWRQATDSGGEVDVAVIELDRSVFPASAVFRSFGPEHLQLALDAVEVGAPLLLPGFPLGFYDTRHHLPVVRHAVIASSFGVRFQGLGYFLTDARTHRGSSGAPVVMRDNGEHPDLPWRLLGVHSARLDMGTRDRLQDESLGLNCAWYADILLALTQPGPHAGSTAGGPAA